MKRKNIPPEDLIMKIVPQWKEDWFLLAAGENKPGKFNVMTVAWGSLGVMWTKPFVQVVVRPVRHTHQFMEKYDTFTLNAFPAKYKDALSLCGSKSGRDVDKIKETGLTPIASTKAACPGFDEAELIIECRKIYRDVIRPSGFMADFIQPNYPQKDYHTIYFGEILAVSCTAKYERT